MLKESYLANIKKLPIEAVKIVVIGGRSVLGPSWGLVSDYKSGKIDWNGYTERFNKEMDNEKCRVEMKRIRELSKDRDVFLICYEGEYPCHRFLLLDKINNLGD